MASLAANLATPTPSFRQHAEDRRVAMCPTEDDLIGTLLMYPEFYMGILADPNFALRKIWRLTSPLHEYNLDVHHNGQGWVPDYDWTPVRHEPIFEQMVLLADIGRRLTGNRAIRMKVANSGENGDFHYHASEKPAFNFVLPLEEEGFEATGTEWVTNMPKLSYADIKLARGRERDIGGGLIRAEKNVDITGSRIKTAFTPKGCLVVIRYGDSNGPCGEREDIVRTDAAFHRGGARRALTCRV